MPYERIPRDVRQNALIMKRKGVKPCQIAGALGISESSIYRIQVNSKVHGDVDGKPRKRGPSAFIPPGIGEVLHFISFN
jgi:hypothetical protein